MAWWEAPGWRVREIEGLRKATVEWLALDAALVSRRRTLLQMRDVGGSLETLATLSVSPLQAALSRLRPLQRALRFMVYNAIPLRDGSIYVNLNRHHGVLRDGSFRTFRGIGSGFRTLRSACALDSQGSLFFGEYKQNPERGVVHIYVHQPGSDRVEIAHSFPPGRIRHVHGIYTDPIDGSLWCVTGDSGTECQVLRTIDGFRSLDIVGAGDESWRCVSLVFTDEAVWYGSDAEFATNHLWRLDRRSGERLDLGVLDGPVYYSRREGNDLFFAVTAELCPSQIGRSATLWRVGGRGVERICAATKDRFSRPLFLPGALYFPGGPGDGRGLVFHAIALSGVDNRTWRLNRESDTAHSGPVEATA